MKISGIIWIEEIIDKIRVKHRVQQDEVREVLNNSKHFRFVEKGHQKGGTCLLSFRQNKKRSLFDRFLCL